MKLKSDFLLPYLKLAPAALAVERSMECELLARYDWQSPILDIGCGDGIFARVLFAQQIDTGIDLDKSEVERARALKIYQELIACPGHAIPKPDGTYRTIFSNSVLEHIPDLLPVLKEAYRLLAIEGRFYVTVPTDRLERTTLPARLLSSAGLKKLSQSYGQFYNRFWRHHHAYDEAKWRQLFEKAGFEVVAEQKYISPSLTGFYDLLTGLALPSLLARKLVGRWFFWPWWHAMTANVTCLAISPIVNWLRKENGAGCLVFFALTKRQTST